MFVPSGTAFQHNTFVGHLGNSHVHNKSGNVKTSSLPQTTENRRCEPNMKHTILTQQNLEHMCMSSQTQSMALQCKAAKAVNQTLQNTIPTH